MGFFWMAQAREINGCGPRASVNRLTLPAHEDTRKTIFAKSYRQSYT